MRRLLFILAALLLTVAGTASERKAAVIFLQFQDLKFTSTYEQFTALTDSLTLYFNHQFKGAT